MKPNKYIHKQTRELIAQAMLDDARGGWYETAQNPRKPDTEILVEVIEQVARMARIMATRDSTKQTVTDSVTDLAALSVAWLQGLTYQQDVQPWT
jgi:hypothetical protein